MKFALTVIGIVLVLEGAPWFLSPAGVRRALIELGKCRDFSLRLLGLGSMLLGLGVVYVAIYHTF